VVLPDGSQLPYATEPSVPQLRWSMSPSSLLVTSVLLVAIVAAIALTMRRRPGLKAQDVAKQVAVRREDRVRLVKMPAERRDEGSAP